MNNYLWKLLYFGTIIILLTVCSVIFLNTLGSINEQIKSPDSFSVSPSGCYVYGNSMEYANLCYNLSLVKNFSW